MRPGWNGLRCTTSWGCCRHQEDPTEEATRSPTRGDQGGIKQCDLRKPLLGGEKQGNEAIQEKELRVRRAVDGPHAGGSRVRQRRQDGRRAKRDDNDRS